MGNPEHCINLLQLAKEISSMVNADSGELEEGEGEGEGEESELNGGVQSDEMFAMRQQLVSYNLAIKLTSTSFATGVGR